MYKRRIIETIFFILINLLIAVVNYFAKTEALKALLTFTFCIILLYAMFWLYELTKYALFSLMFGGIKRSKEINKVISIIICIILFLFTIFVYLIEYPKYIYLNDKLCEKNSLENVKMIDKKTNSLVSYKDYDFEKDKYFTIFSVEMKNIYRKRKYIIYKYDPRYQLLKTYAEIYDYKDFDNAIAFNYLALSFEAILYYKKELKEIKKNYENKKMEYYKAIKSGKDEVTSMLAIQEYLAKTKLNNMKYNEIVGQMRLKPTYSENLEMAKWHNYFKNESDKELKRVINVLNKCNQDFKDNILSKYQSNESEKEEM